MSKVTVTPEQGVKLVRDFLSNGTSQLSTNDIYEKLVEAIESLYGDKKGGGFILGTARTLAYYAVDAAVQSIHSRQDRRELDHVDDLRDATDYVKRYDALTKN